MIDDDGTNFYGEPLDDDYGYMDPSEMTPEQLEQVKDRQADNFFNTVSQRQAQAQQLVNHQAQRIAKGIRSTPKYNELCEAYQITPEAVAQKSIMDPQFRVDLEEIGTRGAMKKHFTQHRQQARVRQAQKAGKGRVDLSNDKNFDAMIDALAGDILK